MTYYMGLLIRRFLWPKRADSFFRVVNGFSFLGITLGVATLIVVMSVMNGFRHELVEKTLAFNAHITLYPHGQSFTHIQERLKNLSALKGVQSVIPLRMGEGMISSKGRSAGVMIRSMPYNYLQQRDVLINKNLMGSFVGFESTNPIIGVGAHLARKLGVRPGDIISLAMAEGTVTPFGKMPRIDHFKVTAIFESGVLDYDQGVVFLPFSVADRYLAKKGGIDGIELFVQNPHAPYKLLPAISQAMGVPMRAVTWADANKRFFQVVETERNVMFIILSLIILIASFNIVSGLVILVKDKTKDISVLKCLGLSKKGVLFLFASIGMGIGVLGTICGVILGFLMALNLETIRQWIQTLTGTPLFDQAFYFLAELPTHMNYIQVGGIVVMSLTFSFLAALYPAWRASQALPAEGLRYE